MASYSFPPFITYLLSIVFLMLSSGFELSTPRSASFPTSIDPMSMLAPRKCAPCRLATSSAPQPPSAMTSRAGAGGRASAGSARATATTADDESRAPALRLLRRFGGPSRLRVLDVLVEPRNPLGEHVQQGLACDVAVRLEWQGNVADVGPMPL